MADGIVCGVLTWASCRVSAAELPSLRKSPGTLGGQPVANGLLRHVDEQTVVAVSAVLKAVEGSSLDPSGFANWSVLASPRFLGRAKFESSFPDYQAEGAWGVSPHLIPGHSLHSPSGTISQVLHAHGPNLGIGGTPGGEREALTVAATWLEAGWADGVWLVLTGRDPDSTGKIAVSAPGDYRALALALVGSMPGFAGPRFRIGPTQIKVEQIDAGFAREIDLLDWLDPVESSTVFSQRNWRVDPGHGSPIFPTIDQDSRIRDC